jgi:hypothetical protein
MQRGDFWRNRLITLFWCSTEIGKYAQQLFLCNSNIFIWGLTVHIVQTLAADLSPLFEANLTNSFFLQIPIWGIWGHNCKQSKQIFEIKHTWILLVSDTDAVGILPVYHSSQQKDTSHFTSFLVLSFLLFYSFFSLCLLSCHYSCWFYGCCGHGSHDTVVMVVMSCICGMTHDHW